MGDEGFVNLLELDGGVRQHKWGTCSYAVCFADDILMFMLYIRGDLQGVLEHMTEFSVFSGFRRNKANFSILFLTKVTSEIINQDSIFTYNNDT